MGVLFPPAHKMQKKPCKPGEAGPELSEAALLNIFLQLPPDWQRRALPAVCKKWNLVCQKYSELWSHVQVSLDADFLRRLDVAALFRWFMVRAGVVRQLEFDIASSDAWAVLHGVLGTCGWALRHLRIIGDGEACYEPGGRAGWLALVPRLTSLEVENAADWTIGASKFPAGLTHLELSYCGEEGLSTVPATLGSLPSLVSLLLQGSQFDSSVDLGPLERCSQLQRLNLAECCLDAVPPCLAGLPGLTSLTLNSNPELGGNGNEERVAPLAALRSLQLLEMRECGLSSLPRSIAGLTNLRTLLLGLNAMDPQGFVPPGPYLDRLAMLGLSDCFYEDTGATLLEMARELKGATRLEVLRINRNTGLQLSMSGLQELLRSKPHLCRLDYSEEMTAPDLDLSRLRARFPGVSFRAVD